MDGWDWIRVEGVLTMTPVDLIGGLTAEQSLSALATSMCNIEKSLDKLIDVTVPSLRSDLTDWRAETERRVTQNEQCIANIERHIERCNVFEKVADIERDRDKFLRLCDDVEKHIEADRPFEYHIGKYAVSILIFVASLVGAFVVNKIMHLF